MKTDKPFVVQREWMYGEYEDLKGFDTWNEAFKWMCDTFDASNGDDDYRIKEVATECCWPFRAHQLMIERCPVCGRQVRRMEFAWTYDCHGIQFRLVCSKCRDELMSKGYDGEYYTEADETIYEDC